MSVVPKNDELSLVINAMNMLINFRSLQDETFFKTNLDQWNFSHDSFLGYGGKVEQEMTGGICNLEEHAQIS